MMMMSTAASNLIIWCCIHIMLRSKFEWYISIIIFINIRWMAMNGLGGIIIPSMSIICMWRCHACRCGRCGWRPSLWSLAQEERARLEHAWITFWTSSKVAQFRRLINIARSATLCSSSWLAFHPCLPRHIFAFHLTSILHPVLCIRELCLLSHPPPPPLVLASFRGPIVEDILCWHLFEDSNTIPIVRATMYPWDTYVRFSKYWYWYLFTICDNTLLKYILSTIEYHFILSH